MSTLPSTRHTAPSNSRLAGMGLLTALSTLISGYVLATIATGTIDSAFAMNVVIAYFLPVISYPLAKVGVLPEFDLWVWYFIGFGWLGTVGYYANVIRQFTGSLTVADLTKNRPIVGFTVIWMGISAPIAYVIGTALAYPLDQTVGLMYLFTNPFALPVAVLTDLAAFSHDPAVWALILVMWVFWWKGIRFVSKV